MVTSNQTGTLELRNSIMVDDQVLKTQQITIDIQNPDQMNIQIWDGNAENAKELYKENRVAIRDEINAFEDKAYQIQDQIISNIATVINE